MLLGLPHLDDFGIQHRMWKRRRMSRLLVKTPASIKSLPDEIAVAILETYLKVRVVTTRTISYYLTTPIYAISSLSYSV